MPPLELSNSSLPGLAPPDVQAVQTAKRSRRDASVM